MLVAVTVLSALLVHKAKVDNEIKRKEELKRAEELRQQEEKARLAAEKEEEERAIASHVYSHRGIEGPYEESFKAYDEVISAGSRNIEMDLVISSDGVLFLAHDPVASYMTGVSASYSSMTADEIDGLTTYDGNKVLRLSEAFDKYERSVNYII